jgi:hypothetical protein
MTQPAPAIPQLMRLSREFYPLSAPLPGQQAPPKAIQREHSKHRTRSCA